MSICASMCSMSAQTHRVTVSLTQEELARLDDYCRKSGRLPRGTALRIAAMETIPKLLTLDERIARLKADVDRVTQ